MDNVTSGYEQIIRRFVAWAAADDNIRAAMIAGSRARTERPADDWADLDIVIAAEDPAAVWQRTDWLRQLGDVWLTFVEPTAVGNDMERRVLFTGGYDVDFAPLAAAAMRSLIGSPLPPEVADVVRRGVRVLVDKEGLISQLTASPLPAQPADVPEPSTFLNMVNDFWYHTLWTAKHMRRGELWWAKGGLDGYLKQLLQQMMEWHARALQGPGHDTWFRGRFLEQWADPRAVAALPALFAHYDEADMWRALFATMEIFRWLSEETAERLQVTYPADGVERTTQLVQTLHSGAIG